MTGAAARLTSDEARTALRDLAGQDLDEEQMARALLDLTLQAAGPDLADAVRLCALPAWFDAAHLAYLAKMDEEEANAFMAQIAEFSFVLPREGGGYTYHEATRARLLEWWRRPENRLRYAGLAGRLAQSYLALAREQVPRLQGPDYREALAALDGAWPNLAAAWQGVVDTESWPLVRDFAYAVAGYLMHRRLATEWITWTEKGLAACRSLGDEAGAANMHNNLGIAYANLPGGDRAANLARAIDCYEEALRFRTPEAAPLDYATTQNNLGNAYANLPTGDRAANLARAIDCFREAQRFYTPEAAPLDYAMTRNNLGTAYRALGDSYYEVEDYLAAVDAYQQAIDLKPDDPWLFNALGNARSRRREHEQAVEAYTAALALGTTGEDRALLLRNRASELICLGRLEEAEQDCQQARALAPDHAYTHARLGDLAFAQGDYAAAADHYTVALARQPEAGFYFDRGLACLALGRQDQALADYQAGFVTADPATIREAFEELTEFAADHPDTPGIDALRDDEHFRALVAAPPESPPESPPETPAS